MIVIPLLILTAVQQVVSQLREGVAIDGHGEITLTVDKTETKM